MAIESDATLTDVDVNSGTAVELNAIHIDWNWSNFLKSVQGPGKPSSLTRNQRLAKNVLLGFDNPNYTVKCLIDIDDTTANRITFALLKSFCESTNAKTLITSAFGTIVVDLDTASCGVDYPGEKGKKISVTISFKEAQV